MSAILGILAANWQVIAGLGAAILAGLGLYAKGRTDEKTKTELKDVRNAIEIHKAGAAARAGVDADVAAGKLRDTDGFKRD